MSAPFVTVIVVNYNSGARLEKCLAHLAAQTFRDFETIVVDNGSEDGSEKPAAAGDNTRLIRWNRNIGFAAANNLAAKEARGEWLAFLNPDAYAEPGWLGAFKAGAERYPEADAFGSVQLDDANPARLDGAGDVCHGFGLYYRGGFGWRAEQAPDDGECFSPCAAAAFYRRETFEKLCGFDEHFFCYGEDVDLGFRLRRSGGVAIQLKDAKVRHEGSGLTGRDSDFSTYHGVRNRLWLYGKNLPPTLFYGLLPLHAVINIAMLLRAMMRGRGASYWRGLRDGVAALGYYRRRRLNEEIEPDAGEIAAMLTWSPFKLLTRAADVRPIKE